MTNAEIVLLVLAAIMGIFNLWLVGLRISLVLDSIEQVLKAIRIALTGTKEGTNG